MEIADFWSSPFGNQIIPLCNYIRLMMMMALLERPVINFMVCVSVGHLFAQGIKVGGDEDVCIFAPLQ